MTHQKILGGNACTPAQKLLGLLSDYKNVVNKVHKKKNLQEGEAAQWNSGATEDGGAGGCVHYGLVK